MGIIKLSPAAKKIIFEHARSAYPRECCGFLLGDDGKERNINLAIKTNNSKAGDQRRRFEISSLDYLKAEQYALKHHTTLLGIYHSHPDHPAQPSEHDLKQAMPFFSYIIVSVTEKDIVEMTSWQLDENGQFDQEQTLF